MPLIFSFWQYAIDHGRKPRAVWAIVGPRGFIFGWSVSKRHAARRLGQYDEVHHGKISLVRICPNV